MFFFFSSRRRHTRSKRDWSSDVCSSDLSLRDVTSAAGLALADHAHHRNRARHQLFGIDRLRKMEKEAGGEETEPRSEERRVGKECRYRWSACHEKKKRE